MAAPSDSEAKPATNTKFIKNDSKLGEYLKEDIVDTYLKKYNKNRLDNLKTKTSPFTFTKDQLLDLLILHPLKSLDSLGITKKREKDSGLDFKMVISPPSPGAVTKELFNLGIKNSNHGQLAYPCPPRCY